MIGSKFQRKSTPMYVNYSGIENLFSKIAMTETTLPELFPKVLVRSLRKEGGGESSKKWEMYSTIEHRIEQNWNKYILDGELNNGFNNDHYVTISYRYTFQNIFSLYIFLTVVNMSRHAILRRRTTELLSLK